MSEDEGTPKPAGEWAKGRGHRRKPRGREQTQAGLAQLCPWKAQNMAQEGRAACHQVIWMGGWGEEVTSEQTLWGLWDPLS